MRALMASMPSSPEHDRDDLRAEAQIGLLQAIHQYDPTRGVKLWTYAQRVVRGHILEQMRRNDTLPRSARRRVRALSGADEFLTGKLHRSPTDTEVASHLNVPVRTVSASRRDYLAGQPSVELREEDMSAVPDTLAYDEIAARLTAALSELGEPERVVIVLYYVEELGMKAIGRIMGVSPAMVSKIRDRAMRQTIAALRGM